MDRFLTIMGVMLIIIKGVLLLISEIAKHRWSELIQIVLAFINQYMLGLLIFGVFIAVYVRNKKEKEKEDKQYRTLPTYNEYASSNYNHSGGGGQSCRNCGSRSIRNWGRLYADDNERIFICNHCGTHLYRN